MREYMSGLLFIGLPTIMVDNHGDHGEFKKVRMSSEKRPTLFVHVIGEFAKTKIEAKEVGLERAQSLRAK